MDYKVKSDRESLMYIIGQIDNIITSGYGYDGEDLKKLLLPIRDELVFIFENIGASQELDRYISRSKQGV